MSGRWLEIGFWIAVIGCTAIHGMLRRPAAYDRLAPRLWEIATFLVMGALTGASTMIVLSREHHVVAGGLITLTILAVLGLIGMLAIRINWLRRLN